MRATGPTPSVRQSVRERDGDQCVWCGGVDDLQVHHRRPRAMGGTVRPETNGQANLILLCARCHSRVESEREWGRFHGLLVRQYQAPADVPLTWHGCCVQLDDDGAVRHLDSGDEPPLISGSSPEPTYAELRARLLLAQSLINQRRTSDGLNATDADVLLGALTGRWDTT
jgi:5-methylcytosine-specific restriction protein A